jgi:translation initiation factor 2B subunit (eIF-2B alpha/beta/delta family)
MNGQTQRRFIIPDGVSPEKMSIYHAIDIIQEAAFKEQCGQRRAKAIQAFVDRVERLDDDLEEIRSYAQ